MSSISTLDTTHLTPAAIDHAPIYVDREATERMLGMLTVEQVVRVLHRPHVGPADVGCALGRVLAHELGHVILSARGHERRDLMRPSFFLEDLIRPQRDAYTLSAGEATRLRQREQELTARSSASDLSSSTATKSGISSYESGPHRRWTLTQPSTHRTRPPLLGNLAERREIPTSIHSHSLFQKNKEGAQLQRRRVEIYAIPDERRHRAVRRTGIVVVHA